MDIVRQAFRLLEAVTGFAGRARRLYYAVVLLGHACPDCGGRLVMLGEGRCRCRACSHEFDPTASFQRCTACGGKLVLAVRRYRCRQCGQDVASRFLFDGLAFDVGYFRTKMAESRQRRQQQRERVRQMLAESRSPALETAPAELDSVPGLVAALNSLTAGAGEALSWQPQPGFDLQRYQSHLLAHTPDFPVRLARIPCLHEDGRKDLIGRFIAAVFLAHSGRIAIWQQGSDIMVTQHETHGEGQAVPGDLEGADGLAGPMGGVEA